VTTLLHTGDTHVGYQQYHSPERRADFRRAFEQVIDDAIAGDVDAVVHAGDLFHDRRPDLRALQTVLDLLSTLRDAEIPFYAIVGNHEARRQGQWLDLFARMGLATRLDRAGTVLEDVTLYGLDHVGPARRANLAYDFDTPETDHAILVGHGLFSPFEGWDWNLGDVIESSTVDFDAVLLGDNHEPTLPDSDGTTYRATVEDTPVTYSGSTERTGADQESARGYNLVTVDPDGPEPVRIARRSLDAARDFEYVPVTLAEDEGVDRVREVVRQHDLADSVAVVRIDGEGEPVAPAAVEEAALVEGALLARVTDHRTEAKRAEDDAEPVEFADPDEAVRERLGELGLSEAGEAVEDIVRSGTADTKVRETVERRTREYLDEPEAFEPTEVSTPKPAASDEKASTVDDEHPAAEEVAPAADQETPGLEEEGPIDSNDEPSPALEESDASGQTDDGETADGDDGTEPTVEAEDRSETADDGSAERTGGGEGVEATVEAAEHEAGVDAARASEEDDAGDDGAQASEEVDAGGDTARASEENEASPAEEDGDGEEESQPSLGEFV
jgi:DNA repair exonuclease SbcCD nuclease subunit